ncbi:hypothetical protein GYA54_04130 [Candidatus Kuenenbacteria bacterium]|nr:hypothetical protein [Candidatus Kuenenbacteria bacterium]
MLKIKYPKLTLLLISYLVVFFIFKNWLAAGNVFILGLGYVGALIAGMMYSYGFTASIGTAIIVLMAGEYNIWVTGLIAGLGSLVSDLVLFRFIRSSFQKEIDRLGEEKVWRIFKVSRKNNLFIKKYIIPVVASGVIASPLPDEIGVTMLAADKLVNNKFFALLSYVLNTAGILIILLIAR